MHRRAKFVGRAPTWIDVDNRLSCLAAFSNKLRGGKLDQIPRVV
jgi:hypothetical protein